MEFDIRVKLAVYRHFVETGQRPAPEAGTEIPNRLGGTLALTTDAHWELSP